MSMPGPIVGHDSFFLLLVSVLLTVQGSGCMASWIRNPKS